MEVPKFTMPELSFNLDGWGPSATGRLLDDKPYHNFSKNERLGLIGDWTGDTYSDKRMLLKYQVQFSGNAHQHYTNLEDDEAFQLVDQGRNPRPNKRTNIRMAQKNLRNRNQQNRNKQNQQGNQNNNNRNNPRAQNKFGQPARRRYDPKNQNQKKRDASVNVLSDWVIKEELDFPRLSKLSLPNIVEGKDIYNAGALEFYDKTYDRITCKTMKLLQRVNRVFHKVTTTDDPIIRKLSKTEGNVFATDAIIATLMCATRSVASWDILVQRVGNRLFFDKRDDSDFDMLTVNETAAEPPSNDENNPINNPRNLSLEATFINHNFSQQVLKAGEKKFQFPNPNPFVLEGDENQVASVGYRYKKYDLGDGVELVVRCEHDAVTVGSNGEIQFMNIKTLNEWDSRQSGGIDWRQKLDIQRGAVLANELKNNACKLAKWTVSSMLAGSNQIKFGYVSRNHFRDSAKHVILGTQTFKPKEFADQTNLNLDNCWGVLRCIIDTCMKLPNGKYLILKDPNKPTLLLYDIPNDSFENDDDDSEEDEEGDEEEEEVEAEEK